MRGPKPGDEMNGTIGQNEIFGNARIPKVWGKTGYGS